MQARTTPHSDKEELKEKAPSEEADSDGPILGKQIQTPSMRVKGE